jgi:hypothetical protein
MGDLRSRIDLMTLTDFIAQAKTLANLIVYVWLFSIAVAVVMSDRVNRFSASFRTLPGIWSPPISEAIQRLPKQPLEHAETFMLLGGLLLLRGTRDLVLVTMIGLLLECISGFLFPKLIRYFKATNLLYSFLGFLLLRGYFEPGAVSVLVTILVGCLCSPMLWGMIPAGRNRVWKAHLICFVGGGLAARFLDAIANLLPTSALW